MSAPQVIGKYQLIAELARGGMGVVYLALASGVAGFSKLLVIKELKPELVEDKSFLDMFLEEARLAALLTHPNIATTYEVGIDGKRPFIVMDYLDGQTLARVLRRRERDDADGVHRTETFSLPMHLHVIGHTLDALAYAHHRRDFDGRLTSVVHRDVSPHNVFITYDGQVKLVDFGIAKASDSDLETRAGVYKGKPAYMSPEQLQGKVDPRCDVFAVGVMLWEALAGRRMWAKKSEIEILTSLLKSEIPSIDEAAPQQPEGLRRICRKAVAPLLEDRYATAQEMRDDLDAWTAEANASVNTKAIGALVASWFVEQRERLRTLIERCIADARTTGPRSLPTIASNDGESSKSGSNGSTRRSAQMAVGGMTGRSVLMSEAPFSGTPGGAAIDPASVPPFVGQQSHSSLRLVIVGAVGALALVAIIVILLTRVRGPSPAEAAAIPTTAISAVAARSPAEATALPPATASAPAASASAAGAAGAAGATGAAEVNDAAASASAKSPPPPTVQTRVVYVYPPAPKPPTKPAEPPPPAPTNAAPPPAPAKADCNPPFYFEGTKKVFKPGCI